MKRLKLLLVLIFVLGTVSAQRRVVEYNEENNTIKITRTRILPKNTDRHDLRIGVGSLSLFSALMLEENTPSYYNRTDSPTNVRDDINRAQRYRTPQYFVGMYSLSYTYQFRHWFQFGGTATFGAAVQWYKESETEEKVQNLSSYIGSIMPTVRFVYLNREKVKLYSTISLGVVVGREATYPCYDLTLFGCSFGKKVFGFAEIGNGIGGRGRIGIGYRFDSCKKDKK